MNIFKLSYKVVRENSSEIYKGFGFKHHSDATQYYLHPDNQSFKGTTTLCQPIGESLVLFSLLCSSIVNGDSDINGDFYFSDDGMQAYFQIDIPEDWRQNEVVASNIYHYKASLVGNTINIAAYDSHGRWIDGNMEHLRPLYKLLPCFCVLLARECRQDNAFQSLLLNFIDIPTPDTFVNIHEDFYQAHKFDEYEINYVSLSEIDYSDLLSFRAHFNVIAENTKQAQAASLREIPVIAFPSNTFLQEYHNLIPNMPTELVIPKSVRNICSAITNGDALSILFHGPSGTGKTTSCKLVCREIKLPVMDVINCTENLDEFVLGKYIPEGDKIVFKESYVTKAIRYGGAVVFEEINFAKPQYLSFLHSLLDDNGFVRLDNGDVVPRNPNFRFFATMNLGYLGTKELNQALYNRFNIIFELAALSDEAIALMLKTRIPHCSDKIDKMLGVYHKLKNKIDSEELDIVISPRNLEHWARLAKYEEYISAAEKTIIPIAKCDRAMEEAIRGILVLYNWS